MHTQGSTIAIAVASLMLSLAATLGASPCQAAPQTVAAAEQPQRITGTLLSVELVPNRPGFKCGHHFELTVAVVGRGREILHVYDMGVRKDDLAALKSREVEIDHVAGGIVRSFRAASRGAGAAGAVAELSTTKHC